MTRALIVLLPLVGFLVWVAWINSPGYLARVRAQDRRRAVELERVKAENEIALDNQRWQAQWAREDFERIRAAQIAAVTEAEQRLADPAPADPTPADPTPVFDWGVRSSAVPPTKESV